MKKKKKLRIQLTKIKYFKFKRKIYQTKSNIHAE